MVPFEVLPSLQVMMALYDAAVPYGSALVNVATVPVKGAPAVARELTPVADNGAGLIVRLVLPTLAPKPVVPAPAGEPLYVAEMVWLPAFSVAMLKLAWPLAFTARAGLTAVLPSRKVMVPPVAGLPPLVTDAV